VYSLITIWKWHVGSRRCALNLQADTAGTKRFIFASPWHQRWNTNVEEMHVKYFYPWSGTLLHVVIFCKSVASQVLLKGSKEVALNGPRIANRTCDWLGWKVIDHPACSPGLGTSDRHPFGLLRRTWLAIDFRERHEASCHFLSTEYPSTSA
jgi:hypothetical protein